MYDLSRALRIWPVCEIAVCGCWLPLFHGLQRERCTPPLPHLSLALSYAGSSRARGLWLDRSALIALELRVLPIVPEPSCAICSSPESSSPAPSQLCRATVCFLFCLPKFTVMEGGGNVTGCVIISSVQTGEPIPFPSCSLESVLSRPHPVKIGASFIVFYHRGLAGTAPEVTRLANVTADG